MASQSTPDESFEIEQPSRDGFPKAGISFDILGTVVKAFASLKLTVVLFALSLILVLAGTLAQVEVDIWDVVRDYFRCWVTWLPVSVFHPLFAPYLDLSGISPRVGIWFPGGFTIGGLMGLNLLAAHVSRFRVQAKGMRLAAGLVVTTIGAAVTWLVIESGHNETAIQEAAASRWDFVWVMIQILVSVLALLNIAGLVIAIKGKKPEGILLFACLPFVCVAAIWMNFFADGRFDDSSMRILWQLVQGSLAGAVLIAGSILLFKKRGPVVVLHAGVGLLFVNEVLVGTTHIETQMAIVEGETVNYARDIREFELVFRTPGGESGDDEVVIRQPRILEAHEATDAAGRRISHERLPFDVELVRYMRNSNIVPVNPARDRDTLTEVVVEALKVKPEDVQDDASIISDLKANVPELIEMFDKLEEKFAIEISDENRETLKTIGEVIEHVAMLRNPTDRGLGVAYLFEEAAPITGTDSGGQIDHAAAYVRLIDRKSDEIVGTYGVGVIRELITRAGLPENEASDGEKTWNVALRHRRYYKPYSVTLDDVSKTDYMGTSTPRDYRSVVRVVNPETDTLFSRHIWMNNPLRYAGETFYQSNYIPPDETGKEATVLAVVSNTGWMIPYVSCAIVGVGMLGHFWLALVRFVRRKSGTTDFSWHRVQHSLLELVGLAQPQDAPTRPLTNAERSLFGRYFPWVAAGVVCFWLLGHARVPSAEDDEPDYYKFGRLPVVYQGRTKPLDTLARNTLRILSNRETWKDSEGKKLPAIRWLLDVISDHPRVRDHRVFRIDHPQLRETLKLKERKGFLYSVNEIAENIQQVAQEAEQTRDKEDKLRTSYERQILQLENKIGAFDLVFRAFNVPDIQTVGPQRVMAELQALSRRQPPLAIPPLPENSDAENDAEAASPVKEDPKWDSFAQATILSVVSEIRGQGELPQVRMFADILDAHLDDDAKQFNRTVEDYQEWLADNGPEQLDARKTDFESFYNEFSPFYHSAWSYLFAFVFSVVALLGWSRPLNRAAFLIILGTFAVHTFALWARIYISGRPPVTNLYSSAVFIGWGAVVLGMVFEAIFKLGIGNIMGSALGAATLGISHFLSGDGDTFSVLQAVLDTQFWLATHVVCITLGYATTFAAGGLGLYFIGRRTVGGMIQLLHGGKLTADSNSGGLLTSPFDEEEQKIVSRMIYGTVCFGILFSFIGTVLGGLWADDSWGRFWGWDPKENGALMIVIWNAMLLHARWDRLVGDRGFAVLAIGGNIMTSWSWFGVNELGQGLHSYGFTEGLWAALWAFWLSQLVCVIVGMLPDSVYENSSTTDEEQVA